MISVMMALRQGQPTTTGHAFLTRYQSLYINSTSSSIYLAACLITVVQLTRKVTSLVLLPDRTQNKLGERVLVAVYQCQER